MAPASPLESPQEKKPPRAGSLPRIGSGGRARLSLGAFYAGLKHQVLEDGHPGGSSAEALPASAFGCALVKRDTARIEVPPVEGDCSRTKAVTAMGLESDGATGI